MNSHAEAHAPLKCDFRFAEVNRLLVWAGQDYSPRVKNDSNLKILGELVRNAMRSKSMVEVAAAIGSELPSKQQLELVKELSKAAE